MLDLGLEPGLLVQPNEKVTLENIFSFLFGTSLKTCVVKSGECLDQIILPPFGERSGLQLLI